MGEGAGGTGSVLIGTPPIGKGSGRSRNEV